MKLAVDQEKLANEKDQENTKDKQDALNEKFQEFKKDIEELEKEGKALKKKIEVPRDKLDEQEVEQEQKKASDALEKNETAKPENPAANPSGKESKSDAKKSQKKAAKKMMEMSQQMSQAMSGMSGDKMEEDIEMLRQILDNLVLFSFDQEALMNGFSTIDVNNNKYASYLKKQNDLKENFEHVDDSLFALSLRQPKLSESVNKEITEVFYNMDKAMEVLAENQLYQGISAQQFTVTAANNLANMLSDVLDNMEENMSMSQGKGQDGDSQLPDMIMTQEQLNEMMKEGLKKSQQGKPKDGKGEKENGKEGEGDKEGDNGSPGEKGKAGSEGEGGKDGGKTGENREGFGEDLNGELYKIYQQQQELRLALEEQLAKEGKKGMRGNGDQLLRQMESVEMELLNNGFNNRTLQKMMQLKHQLMKMQEASFQQGEEDKRESETNRIGFDNNSNSQIPTAKQYFKTTEILNRQSLPLQQIYKKKVQEYFKESHD